MQSIFLPPKGQHLADESIRLNSRGEEIGFGSLVARVWATKGRVLVALFIVVASFVTLLTSRFFTGDKVVTYRQAFDLMFEGLSDGRFPNGASFLISDIINPAVLGSVHRQNDLAGQGIALEEFRHAINIEPYAPDYSVIRQRYQRQLSNHSLDATEIAELQNRMLGELKAANSSSVQISLQLPADTLTSDQARKILTDIPQVWARRAIEEKGVLKLNLPIFSARIFNEERFQNLDYLVGIELLLKNIDLIQQNIESLKKEPNATNVIDEASGYSLEDLQKAIEDVADYDLRQLADPVKELGLARNPGLVKLFYNRRLQDLRLQKQLWIQRAATTRQVLLSYSGETHDEESESVSTGITVDALAPQLGGAFLDRLLEISRQGDNLAYRQELTKLILLYENNALDVENEIAGIQITLDSLNQMRKGSGDRMAVYVKEVEERLPQVLSMLRAYTQVVNRIHGSLGHQTAGNVSRLVQPQSGSFQAVTNAPVTATDINTLIALVVLTLFGAISLSLVVDFYRNRKVSGTNV